MSRRKNRRQFLRDTALAGVGFWVAGGVTLGESKSPNEKINIASIGVGGKGSSDCDQAGGFGNMVALCDIDDDPLNAKAERFRDAKKYHDYRKMFDEMGKHIDAVTVSTPDHSHAPASVMAMKMGKHVYCQKPLTHTVSEARLMRELAQKHNVCTQMGNQGTAETGLREAVEIVQSGGIGAVREVHVWTNRPIWPQAPAVTKRLEGQPIPKNVHWDLFLGPAPYRPYNKDYHPFKWRGWWDFGTGALGDMGCHTANMAFMALKLKHPISVEATSGPVNDETYPGWAHVILHFPERGDMPAVKWNWYEGRKDGKRVLPSDELFAKAIPAERLKKVGKDKAVPGSGLMLIGDKGMLYSPNDYGAEYHLLPKEDFADYKKPKPWLPRNGGGDTGMKAEWVKAIKEGKPSIALSNFGYSGLLTETILLGNVAIRVGGKKLDFDGPNLRFTNDSDADKYLKMEYRKGWTL